MPICIRRTRFMLSMSSPTVHACGTVSRGGVIAGSPWPSWSVMARAAAEAAASAPCTSEEGRSFASDRTSSSVIDRCPRLAYAHMAGSRLRSVSSSFPISATSARCVEYARTAASTASRPASTRSCTHADQSTL